jgi:hypothetical protein
MTPLEPWFEFDDLTPDDRDILFQSVSMAMIFGFAVDVEQFGITVVPDVVVMELAANGYAIPRTYGVRRIDGRTAVMCRIPEVSA